MAHNSFFGVRTSGMYDGKKKKHSQRYKPFRNPQVATFVPSLHAQS